MIYFHANAEDLLGCYEALKGLASQLRVNLICMEYPGFGICQGKTSEALLRRMAEAVFNFVKDELCVPPSRIIIAGRSIGSGPALHLSSRKLVCALLLISPFASLKQQVKYLYGNICSNLIQDLFNNLESISSTVSPCCIIHGLND